MTHFFLQYVAANRKSAETAMKHPYFKSLGPDIEHLKDGKSNQETTFTQLSFAKLPLFILFFISFFI